MHINKRAKTFRWLSLGALGITVALLFGACGSSEGQPEGAASDVVTAPTSAITGGAPSTAGAPASTGAVTQGEQGGGDAPVTTYTDPAGQFRFQYPQTWGKTTQSGESIRYTGADEFISVKIAPNPLPPLDFGKLDAPGLATSSPGYKGGTLKAYKVAGIDGAMVAYTWQLPQSAVSGKPVPSSGNRYYIPGPGGKIAIFTYSSPTRSYDPAGADDFANTFKWL